jgi:uncharacterized protein
MRLHSDGHTRWHDPGDATVLACWDADRLDLGRVGIRPVPHRLCTAPARQPDAIAQALRLSEGRPRQRRG